MSAKSGSGKTDKGTFRARHTLDLKLKVLQLLDQGVIHNTIAGRYKFGLRTVSRVRDERRPLCHAGAGSKPKTLPLEMEATLTSAQKGNACLTVPMTLRWKSWGKR